MPKAPSTGSVDKLQIRLSQQYSSMDGSHPSLQPVPNRHLVTLEWWRTEVAVLHPVGDGWDLEVQIPYDIKDETVKYETPDGQPYENPVGFIHHRTETLDGIGDLRLIANYRPRGLLFEDDMARLGFGLSLPTGRTESDPYEDGALGIKHQHIQFGTGTVDPLVIVGYSVGMLDVSVGLQAPLYENKKGYKGSTVFDWAIGPRVAVTEWLSVAVHWTGVYQTRAYWDGEPDENSGYRMHAVSLSAPIVIDAEWILTPMAMYVLGVDVRSGADVFGMDWMFTLGVTYLLPTES